MIAADAEDHSRPASARPAGYDEPGRGFASLWVVAAVLVAGFLIDVGFGGALAHLVGWIVAAVLVLGVDLIFIYAARATKSLRLDATELRVGDEALPRSVIVGAGLGADRDLPVLGWPTGMPRGMEAVTVRLSDDRRLAIPTRHPDRLLNALGLGAAATATDLEVRPVESEEVSALVEINDRADTVFRVAGYPLPHIETSMDDFAGSVAIFVVGRPPLGFAQVHEVDGLAHLQELAVLPKHMRGGLGTRLLEHACAWARERGYPAMTLTTYRDVPWNAPFYRARGFTEIDELTAGLVEHRAREAELGLDEVGPRIVMRRELGPSSRAAGARGTPPPRRRSRG